MALLLLDVPFLALNIAFLILKSADLYLVNPFS